MLPKLVGYLVRVFRSFSAKANTMSITCVKQFQHFSQAAFEVSYFNLFSLHFSLLVVFSCNKVCHLYNMLESRTKLHLMLIINMSVGGGNFPSTRHLSTLFLKTHADSPHHRILLLMRFDVPSCSVCLLKHIPTPQLMFCILSIVEFGGIESFNICVVKL